MCLASPFCTFYGPTSCEVRLFVLLVPLAVGRLLHVSLASASCLCILVVPFAFASCLYLLLVLLACTFCLCLLRAPLAGPLLRAPLACGSCLCLLLGHLFCTFCVPLLPVSLARMNCLRLLSVLLATCASCYLRRLPELLAHTSPLVCTSYLYCLLICPACASCSYIAVKPLRVLFVWCHWLVPLFVPPAMNSRWCRLLVPLVHGPLLVPICSTSARCFLLPPLAGASLLEPIANATCSCLYL